MKVFLLGDIRTEVSMNGTMNKGNWTENVVHVCLWISMNYGIIGGVRCKDSAVQVWIYI